MNEIEEKQEEYEKKLHLAERELNQSADKDDFGYKLRI